MSEQSAVVNAVVWYHPDTQTITVEVQGDGNGIVIATIPADPPPE